MVNQLSCNVRPVFAIATLMLLRPHRRCPCPCPPLSRELCFRSNSPSTHSAASKLRVFRSLRCAVPTY